LELASNENARVAAVRVGYTGYTAVPIAKASLFREARAIAAQEFRPESKHQAVGACCISSSVRAGIDDIIVNVRNRTQ
jgi:hypothetical protein